MEPTGADLRGETVAQPAFRRSGLPRDEILGHTGREEGALAGPLKEAAVRVERGGDRIRVELRDGSGLVLQASPEVGALPLVEDGPGHGHDDHEHGEDDGDSRPTAPESSRIESLALPAHRSPSGRRSRPSGHQSKPRGRSLVYRKCRWRLLADRRTTAASAERIARA